MKLTIVDGTDIFNLDVNEPILHMKFAHPSYKLNLEQEISICKDDIIIDKHGDGYDNSIERLKNNTLGGISWAFYNGHMEFDDEVKLPNKLIDKRIEKMIFWWGNNQLEFFSCYLNPVNKKEIYFDWFGEIIHNKYEIKHG